MRVWTGVRQRSSSCSKRLWCTLPRTLALAGLMSDVCYSGPALGSNFPIVSAKTPRPGAQFVDGLRGDLTRRTLLPRVTPPITPNKHLTALARQGKLVPPHWSVIHSAQDAVMLEDGTLFWSHPDADQWAQPPATAAAIVAHHAKQDLLRHTAPHPRVTPLPVLLSQLRAVTQRITRLPAGSPLLSQLHAARAQVLRHLPESAAIAYARSQANLPDTITLVKLPAELAAALSGDPDLADLKGHSQPGGHSPQQQIAPTWTYCRSEAAERGLAAAPTGNPLRQLVAAATRAAPAAREADLCRISETLGLHLPPSPQRPPADPGQASHPTSEPALVTVHPSPGLSSDQLIEAQNLRTSDPIAWSVRALARRYNVSTYYIMRATKPPRDHAERVARERTAALAARIQRQRAPRTHHGYKRLKGDRRVWVESRH